MSSNVGFNYPCRYKDRRAKKAKFEKLDKSGLL